MAEQSPIFLKTEALIVWLLQHTAKFPKNERFRMARRIEDAIFSFHECLIRAAQSEAKRQYLWEADIQLDKLRAYLRFSMECGYTSRNQYGYAAQQVTEIGRLLGGWLNVTVA